MTRRRYLSTAAVLTVLAGPAWATGDHTPAPTPTPTPPTQVQGQAQGQGQLQGQGQQQRSTSKATGGNATGGQGGSGGQGGRGGSTGPITIDNSANGGSGGGANGGGYGNGYGQFPASSAIAPSFGVYDKCQEAFSGGLQVFIFGASGGRAYTLDFCKAMMKADYFRNQGRPDMAKALECKFGEFRDVYKETGTPCREDQPKQAAQTAKWTDRYASRAECVADLNARQAANAANVAQCPQ